MSAYSNLEYYDYHLPESQIAQHPISDRHSSKLLIYKNNSIEIDIFKNISQYIDSNTLLIANNTKVIPARIKIKKSTGAYIELFLIEPYMQNMEETLLTKKQCHWTCLIGHKKKWKLDEILETQITINQNIISIKCKWIDRENNQVSIAWDDDNLVFSDIMNHLGSIPLPPYIKRDTNANDDIHYQTMFALNLGAVAAPTAALHFTPEVKQDLKNKQIEIETINLKVGLGTFKPIENNDISLHNMHAESFEISLAALKNIYLANDIIAIGTTSLRTLESLYYIGLNIKHKNKNPFLVLQNMPYDEYKNTNEDYKDMLEMIIHELETRGLEMLQAQTAIMIREGYIIKSSKGIITNFHQPKSSLLCLIQACIGDNWKHLYQTALQNQFRFLSYGDSSLLYFK